MADDEIFLLEVARPGATGGNISAPDWSTIRNDVDGLLTNPVISELNDIPDVTTGTASDGQSLVYNGTFSIWTNGTPTSSITVADDGDTTGLAATKLLFTDGLEWNDSGGTGAEIKPTYAGTGSANTVSRSDHSHNPTIMSVTDIAATGTISSGTRTLVTANFGPLLNGIVYDLEAEGFIVIRNDVNNGTVELRLQVNGGTVKTFSAPNVGGVPSGFSIKQVFATATGTGVTVPVIFSLAYISGDASDIRNGQLFIKAHARR